MITVVSSARPTRYGSPTKIMVLRLVPLLLLIATQFTCGGKFTYPELKNVSEVVVMDRQDPVKRISDPMIIAKLVEFVNKRREGWEEPMTGFPGSRVSLELYRDGRFFGSFGITEVSFLMQRGGRWDSRSATEQEVQELLNILGIDKALLKF
jgi:hypothetical protein